MTYEENIRYIASCTRLQVEEIDHELMEMEAVPHLLHEYVTKEFLAEMIVDALRYPGGAGAIIQVLTPQ